MSGTFFRLGFPITEPRLGLTVLALASAARTWTATILVFASYIWVACVRSAGWMIPSLLATQQLELTGSGRQGLADSAGMYGLHRGRRPWTVGRGV